MSKNVCKIEGCTGRYNARGYCGRHYIQAVRAGDIVLAAKGTCKIDGCDRASQTSGMCNAHYIRARKFGDPLKGGRLKERRGTECSVAGCTKPVLARHLCGLHYKRADRYGDPLGEPAARPSECTVDDCHGKVQGHGLCVKHYARWKTHGNPLYFKPRTVTPLGTCSVDGCDRKACKGATTQPLCKSHYDRMRLTGDPCSSPIKTEPPKRSRRKGTVYTDGTKDCTTCGQRRPLAEFNKSKGRPIAECKSCKYAGITAWRQANPQRVRELQDAWALANPEKVRQMRHGIQHRRRVRVYGNGRVDRDITIEALRERDGTQCVWCGAEMDFTPRKRGDTTTRAG
jgi:hypothetical protein